MSINATIKANIIANPKRTLTHSLSLRGIELFLLVTFFDLAQSTLPMMSEYLPYVPPVYLLGAASVFGSLAWVVRFYYQPGLHNAHK